MDEGELPGEARSKDVQCRPEYPGVQRAPVGIDRVRPITAKVGLTDVEIVDAVRVHRLAGNRYPSVKGTQRDDEGSHSPVKTTKRLTLQDGLIH